MKELQKQWRNNGGMMSNKVKIRLTGSNWRDFDNTSGCSQGSIVEAIKIGEGAYSFYNALGVANAYTDSELWRCELVQDESPMALATNGSGGPAIPSDGIDWEQRRWDAALAALTGFCSRGPRWHNEINWQDEHASTLTIEELPEKVCEIAFSVCAEMRKKEGEVLLKDNSSNLLSKDNKKEGEA